jgi:hypothetical protein
MDIENVSPARRRILAAATLYFAMVFAVGLVLGPARVLWLEPYLGAPLAVLCETPLLLLAMNVAARLAPRWVGLEGGWLTGIAIGLLALLFQQVADLAVGFGLRGMTLQQQWAYFATPAGWLYVFNLIAFAFMPVLTMRRTRQRHEEGVAP